jgi:glyoxylase-like metal-dependent hydrolase (beta-lactamase superfamily II)
MSQSALPRRGFLKAAGTFGAAAGLGLLASSAGYATTVAASASSRPGRRRQAEPWGRLEEVAPDTWALISRPRNDHPEARRTLCNGGIVAGSDGVAVIEGFASPTGAAWMAEQAVRLTGRRPTHVVITHFHGDHTGGTAGYVQGAAIPAIFSTGTTRRLLAEQAAGYEPDGWEARSLLLPNRMLPDDVDETLDLGGRTVRLVGRRGHTPSDLVIRAGGVVFAGDLVWNGLFPNYTHAIPPALGEQVRALRDAGADVWVSGHGELARATDMDRYIDLLDHVGEAAMRALEAGTPLEDAAAAYSVPESLGEWYMFSARYPLVAFRAWERATARSG